MSHSFENGAARCVICWTPSASCRNCTLAVKCDCQGGEVLRLAAKTNPSLRSCPAPRNWKKLVAAASKEPPGGEQHA